MKKRKLLILLTAVLSFSLLFSSCSEDTKQEEGTIAPPSGIAEEAIQHEIRDYFVLKGDVEARSYAGISRIDGVIVDEDEEHKLLAVRTKDLDIENCVIETVKVYDLTSGEVINEQSVTNALYADAKDKTNLNVDIDYPVIRVSRTSLGEEGQTEGTYSYYLAKKNSEMLREVESDFYEMKRFDNGLVACTMGGDVLWIDKNIEIVRTVDEVIANGYDIDSFNAEYQGYVYVWNSNSIQVFNRAGMCSASFEIPADEWLNAFVLNNGNVFFQTYLRVNEYEACDFVYSGTRLDLKSYVMSCTDGALTEINLDFLVFDLENAYIGEEGTFPFDLAQNRQNQAMIHRFANETIATYPEYVVLDNDLKIEYALKNNTPGILLESAYALNANYYVAEIREGGFFRPYIFDLDGNKVAVYANGYVNCSFIVTENAIYNYSMNTVLDIENADFIGTNGIVDEASANVFLQKFNFETAKEEWYLFDGTSADPRLIADGDDVRFVDAYSGLYITDSEGVYTVWSADGTELLVTYGFVSISDFDEIVVIEAEFEGNPMIYVLK